MAGAMSAGTLGSCFGSKHVGKPATFGLSFQISVSDLQLSRVLYKSRLSHATANTPQASSPTTVEGGSSSEIDTVPTPKVIIDQDSDPNATIVEITFGDRLGALLDTMRALKNLGLNVAKANVFLDSSGKHNMFAITRGDTGRKIDSPELLEAIRLTIINNLLQYHPESSAQLAMGAAFGIEPPKEKVDVDIATHIHICDDGPDRRQLSGAFLYLAACFMLRQQTALDYWWILFRSLQTLMLLSNQESLTQRVFWQNQGSMLVIREKPSVNLCNRFLLIACGIS